MASSLADEPKARILPGPKGALPPPFIYSHTCVPSKRAAMSSSWTAGHSCDCRGACGATCPCVRRSLQSSSLGPVGRVQKKPGLLDPAFDGDSVFQCGSCCGCGSGCGNRGLDGAGLSKPVEVFWEGSRGWGLRTREALEEGEFLVTYAGRVLTEEESDEVDDDNYVFDMGGGDKDGSLCVDAARLGNVARFVNHSCEPNLRFVRLVAGEGGSSVGLFALGRIGAGEALSVDYGDGFWAVKWKDFLCHCASQHCRYSQQTIDAFLAEIYEQHYGSLE